jgi:tRNA 2-selenouridine synthase
VTIRTLPTIDTAALSRFDAVIDARSPGEFAQDRLPGAMNLPVLSDAERAEVGTIYVQESRHRARRLGAAYVARNIAAHLEGPLSDKPAGWSPLVYCWRGGQRSHAFATVLAQVGWPVTVLEGGYRTWRRHVTQRLYDGELLHRLVLLGGGTGTGKTELLRLLAGRGVQTLDLEGLANHRGSVFGDHGPQPPQKLFESRLLAELDALDIARPVLVEAESSKVGERFLPPALWRAMTTAPRIELSAPREARAAYLVDAYGEVWRDLDRLTTTMARLDNRLGRRRTGEWARLAQTGDWQAVAEALIEHHYDPAYTRSRRGETDPQLGLLELAAVDDAGPIRRRQRDCRSPCPSAVGRVHLQVAGDQPFPTVAVLQQALLVVEQLLASFGGELLVRPLDDGVHRAGLLAQAAVDALGHVDVVARRAAAAVGARLRLYGDAVGRADRLAQLAGDAALLPVRIAAQRVLAAEPGRLRIALERVVHRVLGPGHVLQSQPEGAEEVDQGGPAHGLTNARHHAHHATPR